MTYSKRMSPTYILIGMFYTFFQQCVFSQFVCCTCIRFATHFFEGSAVSLSTKEPILLSFHFKDDDRSVLSFLTSLSGLFALYEGNIGNTAYRNCCKKTYNTNLDKKTTKQYKVG